jgi:hypothetical protein
MNTLEGLPILDHYKNLLATENEQHAWDILQEFFDYYGKEAPGRTVMVYAGNGAWQ